MTITQAKNKVVLTATTEIGYREGPNNWNRYAAMPEITQLIGWSAQNAYWCNTFVNAVFIKAFGLKIGAAMIYQPIGGGSVLCSTSADFFKAAGAWTPRGRTPDPGDVFFKLINGKIDHMGIVIRVTGGSVITVEGNSSDMVAERVYSVQDGSIAGYGRPRWELAAGAEDINVPANDAPTVDTTPPDVTDMDVGDKPAEPVKRTYMLRLPYLRRGDEGLAVRAAQRVLISCKCTCGPDGADGEFGPNTEKAVLKFQVGNRLAPDGIIGPETGAALFGGEIVKETNINGLGAQLARKIKEGE